MLQNIVIELVINTVINKNLIEFSKFWPIFMSSY